MNTDVVANDLTQLSSREQLSALMDGALPPDQTRFLLRRLWQTVRSPTQATVDAGKVAQALTVASAVAATSRPVRNRGIERSRAAARTQPAVIDAGPRQAQRAIANIDVPVPQPDIVTRPWPRSVLPQYASGGLAVGFGDHSRGAAAYNPFKPQTGLGGLPPVANLGAASDATREASATPLREPQQVQQGEQEPHR
ncbi:MAG: hypothetical protein EOP93_07340 [Lysobacteraceae bacterium]|nr:MAG: hypothetical protein EOP93_07340 [Xanthomonadaceae bacterium]